MEQYVGLDVSVRNTSICIRSAAGRVVREGKVESEPEAIAAFPGGRGLICGQFGIEASPLC